MQRFQLHPWITVALVGEQPVFLDLRRDRYFGVSQSIANAFAEVRSNSDQGVSDAVAAKLTETGLFTAAHPITASQPIQLPTATRELPDDQLRLKICDLLQILRLVIKARRSIRSKPLEHVIQKLRGSCARAGEPESDTIVLAQRFLRARTMIPLKLVCLQDSIALHEWLAKHDACAFLVIGVRLDPFAAHSWVQLGDMVLNDAPDRVSAYTPILVIG